MQLAAESLGDGSALGEASQVSLPMSSVLLFPGVASSHNVSQLPTHAVTQDISRAAERYKELQKEVKSNVDRMASWIEADARELCRCLGVR